ncbi:nickel pincer cofactor biosynthesis protein LarC [Lactonifactor sp. BIOML-A3]|uniref:nickel pincer cofactor biosynthesis protein LarC n=1 Tax=Lactonifactor TaxID=420345 RepID=UPI0012B04889|nr:MULTISPECIES: nickel pincer cofactor biosynthesis protein LarC [Lactonifactor]MCB5714736.1 nickel pincer cofactor biosynthesis protein LarC [Lactonifactor longoviformis]MCB5718690.1 nickel pincer cofactor biosynthesis protein LarC [Lactonifactor longoviformis]MSA03887.1 nickel pincer cofactor biosynthesis protein LarC [Lactonifactor sp. BIOML-A5]MSA10443.1 nickel pincer cofactor biosynthesis protein LarC [Lactonifactor sp. BIOML-A4]MSA14946.1 nickel pincer cofactor biosynthesis protein LarC
MSKSDKLLYLECYSGISGDMTVGALLDLGAREEILRRELAKLPVAGYELKVGRAKKCGIDACDFDVILQDESSHGEHTHGHHHHGEHTHGDFHTHHHEHRTYGDISRMLQESCLEEPVLEMAKRIFRVVAEAEAKVHRMPLEEVHFHEVGAVDSIVDIVAAAVCLHDLGISRVAVSVLHEGTGTTWCQHGRIPVPAPAVLEMMARYELPVKITENEGEMITPTGAAIAAALRTEVALPEQFVVKKIGMGAGKKEFAQANILRAMILETKESSGQEGTKEGRKEDTPKESVWVLETNVDDCTGEQLGYTIEQLMNAGALDAGCFPVGMKKNRPGYMLQVICREDMRESLENLIFKETTSIGLRRYQESRRVLEREFVDADTPWGTAKVKVCSHHGERYYYPEYSSVKEISKKAGISLKAAYDEIQKAAEPGERTEE